MLLDAYTVVGAMQYVLLLHTSICMHLVAAVLVLAAGVLLMISISRHWHKASLLIEKNSTYAYNIKYCIATETIALHRLRSYAISECCSY